MTTRLRVTPFGVAHSWPTLLARTIWVAERSGAHDLACQLASLASSPPAEWQKVSEETSPPDVMGWIEARYPIRYCEGRDMSIAVAAPPDPPLPDRWPSRLAFNTADNARFTVRCETQAEASDVIESFRRLACAYMGHQPRPTDTMFRAYGVGGNPANIDNQTRGQQ